ncbi:HVA22-like protein k isoform X2 [Ziziphus jujuba]|uniref:HVA22-like protein n=1 Tax=Ziziphus jujuba TaxID=326968 RepID=A0ABM3ITB8_ZIZJJ|nr:HVA22-like protein k isoform X2 [Ziziphus jujuba]
MALLGSNIAGEVGLRLLLCPLGSNIVVRTACCSVGIVLPVYSTCKAIERKDHDDQQKWLLYWAAYGSFSLVEVFSDKFISWFPLYYHLKFAFLVWLQLPSVDAKLISAHQTEIQYARAVIVKIMGSAELMLKGGDKPDQTQQHRAIEGQTRTSVIESDDGDDD